MKKIIDEKLYKNIKKFISEQNYIYSNDLEYILNISKEEVIFLINRLEKERIIKKNIYSKNEYVVCVKKPKLKIYLLDKNKEMTDARKEEFKEYPEIEIFNEEFCNFIKQHKPECVVSPGNSYGSLSGGYDSAILSFFGYEIQFKIQNYIHNNFYGEQPIATSILIKLKDNTKIIHTPTMQLPNKISDPFIIYQCMRTTLITALKHHISSIVIPAFGAGCGNVDPKIVAKNMKKGLVQILKNK